MSNSQTGLMTAEQWSSYLSEWCWHILQQRNRDHVMSYALIPDGFSLKKVTKSQKEAVDAKRRHDDVVAVLTNPNTPIVIGSAIATYFGVRLGKDIVTDLEAKGVQLTDDVKDTINQTVKN